MKGIHIVGVAYKRDVGDVRESPAIDIMGFLGDLGAVLSYTDPFVKELRLNGKTLRHQPLDTAAADADCCLIVTDHSDLDYPGLVRASKLVVDTRNCLRGFPDPHIVRL